MGPGGRLDALGKELDVITQAISKDPAQLLNNSASGPVSRLKSLLEEMQAAGQQELSRAVAESQANAETAKALQAEMEAKVKAEKAARREAAAAAASQAPAKPAWPPDTGGLPLTLWFEKEFAPPEEQVKSLTTVLVELVQKKPPAAPAGGQRPRR